MTPDLLLQLGLSIAAALVGVLLVAVGDPDDVRLAGAPLTPSDALREGSTARVEGVLRAARPLVSPLGETCLHYRIIVFHYVRRGERQEEVLWSATEMAEGLAVADAAGEVLLDLEGGEIRVAEVTSRTFNLLTDREALPGTLSRDLPPEVKARMTHLRAHALSDGERVTAAGQVSLLGGRPRLGGRDVVLSNESDTQRAGRRRGQRGLGVLLVLGGLAFAAWSGWSGVQAVRDDPRGHSGPALKPFRD